MMAKTRIIPPAIEAEAAVPDEAETAEAAAMEDLLEVRAAEAEHPEEGNRQRAMAQVEPAQPNPSREASRQGRRRAAATLLLLL